MFGLLLCAHKAPGQASAKGSSTSTKLRHVVLLRLQSSPPYTEPEILDGPPESACQSPRIPFNMGPPKHGPLVARFARINSHDSRESGDSRESETQVIRANRPDALQK